MKQVKLMCKILELDVVVPEYLGNGHAWEQGYRAGAHRAKGLASVEAIKYDAYTETLEKMLMASGVSEGIIKNLQEEFGV